MIIEKHAAFCLILFLVLFVALAGCTKAREMSLVNSMGMDVYVLSNKVVAISPEKSEVFEIRLLPIGYERCYALSLCNNENAGTMLIYDLRPILEYVWKSQGVPPEFQLSDGKIYIKKWNGHMFERCEQPDNFPLSPSARVHFQFPCAKGDKGETPP